MRSKRQYSCVRFKNFASGMGVVYNDQGMPFNRPLPDSESKSKRSSGVDAIVKAETGIQIALILPSSVVVCWLIGAWADRHFHQSWISIVGVVFGAISGLVYIIQYVVRADRQDRNDTATRNGTGEGPTGSDR